MNDTNKPLKGQDKNLDIQNIKIEADDDLIFTFVRTYKFFLAHGKIGQDGYILYSHLQFTARLQQTNSVLAKNVYLSRGLQWTEKRVKQAKAFLHRYHFIEYRQSKGAHKYFENTYIVVRTTKSPQGSFAAPPVDGTSRESRQMLQLETKCFNKQSKINGRFLKETENDFFLSENINNVKEACKKLLETTNSQYTLDFLNHIPSVIQYFFEKYEYHRGETHPIIRPELWPGIIERIIYYGVDADSIYDIVDQYFCTALNCDYRISHFSQDEILYHRLCEVGRQEAREYQ